MKEIMNLINAWDPIGFFPLAPKDEYINEIRKIETVKKKPKKNKTKNNKI